MTNEVLEYLHTHREQHLQELMELVRIPSVSSKSEHKGDMRKAAEWLAANMRKIGLENVQIMETAGHPVVYADWMHAEGQPTALIYGHYDVQPAEPLDQWETPPFEPVIKDNKLFGRGSTDDKAQMFMHVKTVEAYFRTAGKLPVNVKFCIEGEEEMSSPNLPTFVKSNAELLKADMMVISDGPMHDKDTPSICVGLRGLCGFEIEVKGPKTELHSGMYGGGVANPVTALVELLASMRDERDHIAVEGFYDKVRTHSDAEREANAKLNPNEEELKRHLNIPSLRGEQGYTFYEHTAARPTLEINGLAGGYFGEGLKPIVPSSAIAKMSCRLVDEQDPDEIMDLIEKHIEKHRPQGVTVTMKKTHRGKPFFISPEHPYIQKAAKAYEVGWGKEPVYIRSGGSIPIVQVFVETLQFPVVMMDFGLPEENMHGPNEHYHLDNYDRGIRALTTFWSEFV